MPFWRSTDDGGRKTARFVVRPPSRYPDTNVRRRVLAHDQPFGPHSYRAAQPSHHDSEAAMQYLCLVYQEETTLDALSEAEHDAIVSELRDYCEHLRQSGHY